MNQVSPVSIAQVTDMHLFARENQQLLGMPTVQSFQVIIERLKKLCSELDLLLLTGDLSSDGTHQSYENLQNLLNPLKIPTYWLPGNHDSCTAMQEVLNIGMISRRKSFERGSWNFILLNSSVSWVRTWTFISTNLGVAGLRVKNCGQQTYTVSLTPSPCSGQFSLA